MQQGGTGELTRLRRGKALEQGRACDGHSHLAAQIVAGRMGPDRLAVMDRKVEHLLAEIEGPRA